MKKLDLATYGPSAADAATTTEEQPKDGFLTTKHTKDTKGGNIFNHGWGRELKIKNVKLKRKGFDANYRELTRIFWNRIVKLKNNAEIRFCSGCQGGYAVTRISNCIVRLSRFVAVLGAA